MDFYEDHYGPHMVVRSEMTFHVCDATGYDNDYDNDCDNDRIGDLTSKLRALDRDGHGVLRLEDAFANGDGGAQPAGTMVTYAFGPIFGGHVNPAISLWKFARK